MKLKKQKIGYWIESVLLDIGIILLAQSGWETRLRYFFFAGKKDFCPYCRSRI